jgi:hypothetical protein
MEENFTVFNFILFNFVSAFDFFVSYLYNV